MEIIGIFSKSNDERHLDGARGATPGAQPLPRRIHDLNYLLPAFSRG